jgi:hypothetical protein
VANKVKPQVLLVVLILFAVISIVVFSAGASRVSRFNDGGKFKTPSPQKPDQAFEEHRRRYPMVNYDGTDQANGIEKARRQNRNKHYDRRGMVDGNAYPSTTAVVQDSEVFLSLPALPVAQSDVVLTAQILNSAAHLSNDKSAVYSEFCVQIETVIKGVISESSKKDAFTVSRVGGVVVYPTGQKVRYEVARQNMPVVGKTYLFFLKATQDPAAYEILTGYEIGPERISPLDDGTRFEAYSGTDSVVFLNSVRSAVSNQN